MEKIKRISGWLQVLALVVLIFITIPYTPLLWKLLSAHQKSFAIVVIYFLAFLFGILILIYLVFYKKERKLSPYLWFLVITILYIQSLNTLKDFPIEKIHLIEYGALGFLIFKALKNDLKDLSIYIWSALIICYIGIIDETIQWIVPNRVGTIEDVWINIKSGGLVLMLIGLVIRPGEIEKRFNLNNLKKIYIPISLVLVVIGVFVNFIHDFGYKFRVNDFIEIYSHFPKEKLRLTNSLLQQDLSLLKLTAQRFEGLDDSDKNISIKEANAMIFFKEAGDHKWERENAFSKNRFLKSLKEHIILKDYYSSVLYFNSFKWSKDKELLVETFAKKEKGESIYISPASGILITKFSKIQMWVFIFIGVAFFTVLFFKTKI